MFSLNNTILIGYPGSTQQPFTIRYIRPWADDGSALISEDGDVWYPTNDKMLWSELPDTNTMTPRYNYSGDPKIIKQLEKIASEELRVETLKTRYSDSLDFHDIGVTSLLAALYRAYNAGFNAGTTI